MKRWLGALAVVLFLAWAAALVAAWALGGGAL